MVFSDKSLHGDHGITVAIIIIIVIIAFSETPSTQVVGVGQEAVFRCQNPNATAIGWALNGSEVGSTNPPPGVTPRVNTLTIVALSNYNETEVVCLAFSRSWNGSTETTPVSLLIQGLYCSSSLLSHTELGYQMQSCS